MKVIDTHAHLYLNKFREDIAEVIHRAKEKLHFVVLPNIDKDSIDALRRLVENYPEFCYSALGLHPTSVKKDYISQLNYIEKFLQDFPNIVAIGEIGLDYYWDKSYIKEQKDALRTQIRWAKELNLPIILHARDSLDDLITLVSEEKDENLTGVFHCFTGNVEHANKITNLDFFLGIGGIFTFKKSNLPEVLEKIGLNNVVLETDSPYLAPVPFRGKRNESAYTYYIAKSIAEKLNITFDIVAEKTNNNAIKLFNLRSKIVIDE